MSRPGPGGRSRSAMLVGPGWALHLGDGRISGWHQHHALQVNAAMTNQVSLVDQDGQRLAAAGGWLIAPDHPHRIHCEGPLVTLLVEPDSAGADAALALVHEAPAVALTPVQSAAIASEAAQCWDGGWRITRAEALVSRVLDGLGPSPQVPRLRDRRINALLKHLTEDPASTLSLRELSDRVGLSPTRVTHLFRAQVGIAIRPYRLWLRLQVAARWMAKGASATEAAVHAGFSDSAHFTRTCKRIVGLNPSALPQMQVMPPAGTLQPRRPDARNTGLP